MLLAAASIAQGVYERQQNSGFLHAHACKLTGEMYASCQGAQHYKADGWALYTHAYSSKLARSLQGLVMLKVKQDSWLLAGP